jgi:hypothetical protein
VSALPEQGARSVLGAEAIKKFAVSPPLFAHIKGFHVRIVDEKMWGKGKEKKQPSSIEERLPAWAEVIFELKARAELSQPAQALLEKEQANGGR